MRKMQGHADDIKQHQISEGDRIIDVVTNNVTKAFTSAMQGPSSSGLEPAAKKLKRSAASSSALSSGPVDTGAEHGKVDKVKEKKDKKKEEQPAKKTEGRSRRRSRRRRQRSNRRRRQRRTSRSKRQRRRSRRM